MATVRGMTPEAIRALLKREIGDYGSTLAYAQQALANSQALANAVSEFERKLDALPDELEINDEQLKVLEGTIAELKTKLEQNNKDLAALADIPAKLEQNEKDLAALADIPAKVEQNDTDLAALSDLTTTLQEASDALDSALGELSVSGGMYQPGNLVWNPTAKENMFGWLVKHRQAAKYLPGGGVSGECIELSWTAPPASTYLDIGATNPDHMFDASPGQEFLVSLYVKPSVTLPEGAIVLRVGYGISQVDSPVLPANVWTRIQGVSKFTTSVSSGRTYLAILHTSQIPQNATWQICNPSVVEMAGDLLVVNGAISADKIAANAVTTVKLAADSVVADKIAANAVTTVKLAADSVVAGKIAANSVNTRELVAGSVKSDQIYANSVTTAKIAANAITANEIAANAVTTVKLAADSVVAGKIAANAVNTRELIAGSVKSDQIYANAVTTAKIAANAVTANEIAANAVTTNQLAASSVTSAKIFAGAITTDKLSASAVTADKVAANSIGTRELIISPGNLFPDPNFTDPCWGDKFNGSGITLVGTGKQTGVYYQPSGMVDVSMLVEPGGTYRLTARCRFGETDGVTYANVYCRHKKVGGGVSTVVIGKIPRESQVNYAYGTVSINMTFPSDMEDGRCTIGFFIQSAHKDGNVEIHNVRIVRAADAALIVQGAIKADHISAGSLTSDKMQIANGFITNAMIANAAINAAKIQDGQITNAKIANLDAGKINTGTLSADRIASNSITAAKIAADTITAKEIRAEVFTQVGTNMIPLVPGSIESAWTKTYYNSGSNKVYPAEGVDDSVYSGFKYYSFDRTYSLNEYSNLTSVDSSMQYDFTFWCKSPQGSHLYIELRDQNGGHAVETGGINNRDPNGIQSSSLYLVSNLKVPTTWTKYTTTITLRPNVTGVRVASIYGSHTNGPSGVVHIGADMSLNPSQVTQQEVDRRQDEQFVLHENQLKWLRWTKVVYDYAFTTSSSANDSRISDFITTGLIDVEMNQAAGKSIRFIRRPGWSGKYKLAYTIQGQAGITEITGTHYNPIQAEDSVYALTSAIRFCEVTVYPDHTAEPREWVCRVVNTGISWGGNYVGGSQLNEDVIFDVGVIPSEDVVSSNGVVYASGATIPRRTRITRAASIQNGLVVFTEDKPELQYEIGAPTSGTFSRKGSSQTIPQNTWVEVVTLTAPAWDRDMQVEVDAFALWDWWNALSGSNYRVELLINGSSAWLAVANALGSDDVSRRFTQIITIPPKAKLVLRVYATAGLAIERKLLSSWINLRWGTAIK